MLRQIPELPGNKDKNDLQEQTIVVSEHLDVEGSLSTPVSSGFDEDLVTSPLSPNGQHYHSSQGGIPLRRSIYSKSFDYSPVVEEFDRVEISPSLPNQNTFQENAMKSTVTLTEIDVGKDKSKKISNEEIKRRETKDKSSLDAQTSIEGNGPLIKVNEPDKPLKEPIGQPPNPPDKQKKFNAPSNTHSSVKEMEEMLMKIQKLRSAIAENGRLIKRPSDIHINESEKPSQVSSKKSSQQVSPAESNSNMKKKLIHWMSQTKGHTPSSSISSTDLISIPPTPPLITSRHSINSSVSSSKRSTSGESSSVYSQPMHSPSNDIEELKSSIEHYRQTLNALNDSDVDINLGQNTSSATIRHNLSKKQLQTPPSLTPPDTDTRQSCSDRRPYSLMSSAESFRTARSFRDPAQQASPHDVTPLKTSKADVMSPTTSDGTARIAAEKFEVSAEQKSSPIDEIRRVSNWSQIEPVAIHDRSVSAPSNATEAKRAANRISRSRAFSQANIQHLLTASDSSFQIDNLDIPPEERHLLERFVDALSKLSVEINMDEGKRVEGKRRLHNALRAIEGWI